MIPSTLYGLLSTARSKLREPPGMAPKLNRRTKKTGREQRVDKGWREGLAGGLCLGRCFMKVPQLLRKQPCLLFFTGTWEIPQTHNRTHNSRRWGGGRNLGDAELLLPYYCLSKLTQACLHVAEKVLISLTDLGGVGKLGSDMLITGLWRKVNQSYKWHKAAEGWGGGSVAEHLPCECEALDLSPSAEIKKKYLDLF